MGGYYDYATHTYYNDPQSAVVYQSATDGTPLGQTMFYEEPSWLADSNRAAPLGLDERADVPRS